MAKAIGGGRGTLCIDIGSNSVKFVKLEAGRVVDYGLKEIGEAFDVPSILRELVKDYKPREVYTFVSGPSVSVRQAPFPKMNRRELKDAILLRLEKYSPFTLDEAIFDFKTLGPVREAGAIKDNVMVIAARKDIVSDHISTLRKAGLEPTSISVIPFCLQAAVRKFGRVRPDETVCLLDVGAEFTDMVFMKGERLDLARTITTAGNAITEAMTVAITTEEGQLALDAYDAENLKRKYGVPSEDSQERLSSGIMVRRLATLQRPALERFVAEVNRSIDYYRREFGEQKIDRLLLCGGTAAMKGLREYLQTSLGIPVELFDPFKEFGLYKKGTPPEEEVGYRLVTALGLSFDHTSVDLLPSEMRTGKFVARDIRMVTVGGILWVGVLIVGFVLVSGWSALAGGQVGKLKSELTALEEANKSYFALEKEVKELESRQGALKQVVGDVLPTVSNMAALTSLVPNNIQLSTFAVTNRNNVKMTGTVTGEPHLLDIDLSQFMIDLERSPNFKQVQLVSKNRGSLQGETVLEFEIQCVTE
uniref:Type IV pilus assembly protein PilM n=1 Tax=candidate division WOR-3 bacterium TaxID=2052148 RepID=A0A7C4GH49_UNCW3